MTARIRLPAGPSAVSSRQPVPGSGMALTLLMKMKRCTPLLLRLGQQVAGALQRNLTVYPGWARGGMGMACGVDDDIDIFRRALQGIGLGQISLEQVY